MENNSEPSSDGDRENKENKESGENKKGKETKRGKKNKKPSSFGLGTRLSKVGNHLLGIIAQSSKNDEKQGATKKNTKKKKEKKGEKSEKKNRDDGKGGSLPSPAAAATMTVQPGPPVPNGGLTIMGAPPVEASVPPFKNMEIVKKFVDELMEIEKRDTLGTHFVKNLTKIVATNSNYKTGSANPTKNRSAEIFCIDETRVKLKNTKQPNVDYIHANLIKFENLKREYIATQHPLQNTIDEFWGMIFNENIETIVSLTNNKLATNSNEFPVFYPQEKDSYNNFGDYFVSCKSVKIPKCKYQATEYNLEVLPNGCSNSSFVRLLRYKHWGRNLVPASCKVIPALIKNINSKKFSGPLVIQCEHGMNQSSILIMVDVIIGYLNEGQLPQITKIYTDMKNQRFGVIPQRFHLLYAISASLYIIKYRIENSKQTNAELTKNIDGMIQCLAVEFSKVMSVEPHETNATSPELQSVRKVFMLTLFRNTSISARCLPQ